MSNPLVLFDIYAPSLGVYVRAMMMMVAGLALMACAEEAPPPVVHAPTQGHYTEPVKTPEQVAAKAEAPVAVAEARPAKRSGPRRYRPSSTAAQPAVNDASTTSTDYPNSIEAGAARYQGQLDYCMTVAKRANPAVSGRLEISISVADGRTSARVIGNTTGDDELGTCAVKKIRRWRFDNAVKGQFNWPFMIH